MNFFSFKTNFTHLVALAFFVTATLNITACSSSPGGYTTNSAASAPTAAGNAWNNVATQGFVSGGPWGNNQILSLDQATETVTLQIPLPNAPAGISEALPVTEINGATVSISQDSTGQWYFQFTMPLSLLVKGIAYQNPSMLPNGEALPAIPAGELPTVAAHISPTGTKYTFYVYGSVKYFAIFMPTPSFNPTVALQYPIMNSSKTEILGYFNTIPDTTSTSKDGGLYVAMVFPQELQILLDTYLN